MLEINERDTFYFKYIFPNNIEYGNKVSQAKVKANMICECIFERNATCLENACSESSHIPSKNVIFKNKCALPFSLIMKKIQTSENSFQN